MDGEILRIIRSVLLSNIALIDSAVKKMNILFFPPSVFYQQDQSQMFKL